MNNLRVLFQFQAVIDITGMHILQIHPTQYPVYLIKLLLFPADLCLAFEPGLAAAEHVLHLFEADINRQFAVFLVQQLIEFLFGDLVFLLLQYLEEEGVEMFLLISLDLNSFDHVMVDVRVDVAPVGLGRFGAVAALV
jgi:hypothetical protein